MVVTFDCVKEKRLGKGIGFMCKCKNMAAMSVFGCSSKSTLSTQHTTMPSFRNTSLNVRDMKTILNKREPSNILLSSGVGCGDYQIRVETPTNTYGHANIETRSSF